MPRPKRAYESVQISVSIPKELKLEIDKMLYDPVHQTIRHGALTQLIIKLLREWARQRGGAADAPVDASPSPDPLEHFNES